MFIGIYANPDRDNDLLVTGRLKRLLEKKGVRFVVNEDLRNLLESGGRSDVPDAVVTLGGDGTILSAVGFAAERKIPLLGINLGHIGFLTECGEDRLEECVERLCSGDYSLSDRAMIETEICGRRVRALNEIALYKKNIGRTVTLTVRVGGSVLSRFKCDGFIVSTPTGSTGYALASGGPIIGPRVKCNVLVPISGHHLSAKPVVVDDCECVEIFSDEPACVIADGRVEEENVTSVKVSKSDIGAVFVKMNEKNFYSKLHEKLDGEIKENGYGA